MTLEVAPFGTYTDVTGVVDATAAAEIVVLLAALDGLLNDSYSESAAGQGNPDVGVSEQSATSPEFDRIDRVVSEKLAAEITALAAAIAAAPTA